jgi:hypothetical protein
VLDQPVTGRIFFEEVIRENLDIGWPSQVSLIFDRKITGRTPGRFRTRVITDGVVPSLHIDTRSRVSSNITSCWRHCEPKRARAGRATRAQGSDI